MSTPRPPNGNAAIPFPITFTEPELEKLRFRLEGPSVARHARMQTFIMLTTLEDASIDSPQMFERREKVVMDRVRERCAGVEWIASYATLGPYDYVDIFRAPSVETALEVSTLMRAFGHARTEVWPATEWKRFEEIARSLMEPREVWR